MSLFAKVIPAQASKNTFMIPPIRELLLEHITDGLWLDPFANNANIMTDLPESVTYITNDLNSEYATDYNEDFEIFLPRYLGEQVTGINADPPYSTTKAARLYNSIGVTPDGWRGHDLYHATRRLVREIRPKLYIQHGWNSNGPGGDLYERIDHLIVPHGSSRNDTIVTVWELRQSKLDGYFKEEMA